MLPATAGSSSGAGKGSVTTTGLLAQLAKMIALSGINFSISHLLLAL